MSIIQKKVFTFQLLEVSTIVHTATNAHLKVTFGRTLIFNHLALPYTTYPNGTFVGIFVEWFLAMSTVDDVDLAMIDVQFKASQQSHLEASFALLKVSQSPSQLQRWTNCLLDVQQWVNLYTIWYRAADSSNRVIDHILGLTQPVSRGYCSQQLTCSTYCSRCLALTLFA